MDLPSLIRRSFMPFCALGLKGDTTEEIKGTGGLLLVLNPKASRTPIVDKIFSRIRARISRSPSGSHRKCSGIILQASSESGRTLKKKWRCGVFRYTSMVCRGGTSLFLSVLKWFEENRHVLASPT